LSDEVEIDKKTLTNQRTAAVRESLEKEKGYVREGKGTREWTPEQQEEIMAGERPKDDNGKAYEGHHMKSVSKYPAHAGNRENIQWLSRDEHKAAHGGNFHTPTNGRYNPDNGCTKVFFDNQEPKAPEPQPLKELAKPEEQANKTEETKSTELSTAQGKGRT